MNEAVKLLPCPFCGGQEPSLQVNSHAGMSWVSCPSCGLEAPSETGVSAEEAITYWNSRTQPSEALVTDEMVERALNAEVSGPAKVSDYLSFNAADARGWGVLEDGEDFHVLDIIRQDQMDQCGATIVRAAISKATGKETP